MSVYFARVKGYVKIGYSVDPTERISSITTGSCIKPGDVAYGDPIDLLGWIPGDRTVERETHMRFGHLHVTGEWFWDDEAYEELIEANPYGAIMSLPSQVVLLMREFPNATRAQVVEVHERIRSEALFDPASDTSLAVDIFGGREAADAFRDQVTADFDARRAADRAYWRSQREAAA